MTLNINTDGGSRGNPGLAACAFVIKTDQGNLITEQGRLLGTTTNNTAEYEGVISALSWVLDSSQAKSLKEEWNSINFFLDSLLVVNQLNGIYKIKEKHLASLHQKIITMINQAPIPITFKYVPRSQNQEADTFLNRLLDAS